MTRITTPKLCFVIMPFSEERKEVYKHGIAPACQRAGFAAVRVDELKGHFNINRKIIEHIFSSDAVIAEITDHNPNVFYEMGVAHAIGNKTIPGLRQGRHDRAKRESAAVRYQQLSLSYL